METSMADLMRIDWFALAPELSVLTAALLILLVELTLPPERKKLVNFIGLGGMLTALVFVAALAADGSTRSSFGTMFVVDGYALLFKAFFLSVGAFVLFLSYRYFSEFRTYQGEYYFLLMSAFLGMLLMPSARDLVMLFIGLELVSVPGFVMAGMRKFDLRSNEGALKFFLIGVLSVAVLLFGLSVVYGYTGTTDMAGVAQALEGIERTPFLLASVLFVMVGFGFKISAVPFHFWAPDTYEGAPVPVAAFLSVASKAAGFAGLLQICFVAFLPLADVWAPVLGVIAVVTMTLGNLTALQQRNVVRLFAYSSVAHAGYMLVPFALVRPDLPAVNAQAFASVLIYLISYGIMNIGAFAVVTAVARQHPARAIADYAGLGRRSPATGAAFTTFLLSLGGVPPTIGFWAKFFIFVAAVDAGAAGNNAGYVLAAAVVINSVIAMFYYLALARTTWMDDPAEAAPILRPGFALNVAMVVLALAAVVSFFGVNAIADPATVSTLAVTAVGGG
jgi:NADH-quinone oxidoreductase subunit N